MSIAGVKWPLGVFASIDAGLGVPLSVAAELGVPTIQLHAPHEATRTDENAERFLAQLAEYGLTLTVVFGGFEGESYADIPTVSRTVGLVPPATRQARLREMLQISTFARRLNCDAVGLHVGFVPHDRSDPNYREVVGAVQLLCNHAAANGQTVNLETGQEAAESLLQFIGDVGRPNLGINFDPANMILYGTGQPLEALRQVGPYVRSVHCKDALWAANPGAEWGQEVALGQGAVDIAGYLKTLDEIGYTGPLTIERELSHEPATQKRQIAEAIALLNRLKAAHG